MEGTAMFREPVCQRNRFKKKIVYHAAMEGLHCPGKGINDNGVSCRKATNQLAHFVSHVSFCPLYSKLLLRGSCIIRGFIRHGHLYIY